MKKTILLLSAIAITQLSVAQNVYIPDSTFKAKLLQSPSINLNSDTEIQLSEANNFTGVINVTNAFTIADMTGLEEFTQITELHCAVNEITTLDVSNNSQLTIISCYANSISTLILGNNTNLTELKLNANMLTVLDLSMYPNLIDLNVSLNPLLALNVANGNNTNFTFFSAFNTPDLACVQVDDPAYSSTNWSIADPNVFSLDCFDLTSSISEEPTGAKEVIAIYDQMGRKTQDKPNALLIFHFSDGSTEKRFRLE